MYGIELPLLGTKAIPLILLLIASDIAALDTSLAMVRFGQIIEPLGMGLTSLEPPTRARNIFS